MASPAAPANKIERAHQLYRDGRYEEALGFYTEALSVAKIKQQKIALHSNRAACYLKLHDFKKCQLKLLPASQAAEECTSVLELDYNHTGALMLRAQTLVTLKEYNSALFDVNRLIELNPSSEVYQNLQARKSLAPIPESEAEFEEEEEEEEEEINQAGPYGIEEEEGKSDEKEDAVAPVIKMDNKGEPEVKAPKTPGINGNSEPGIKQRAEPKRTNINEATALDHTSKKPTVQDSKGWQAIPKPKGHSTLDYARWDRVEDDSSEDDDDNDEEESQPQYRFRVRTVGVRPVK
ncbi:TPR REGION domain-containing protein [Citrus sinensis]|nr:TPR REGION domain-containing protein [Citrus sinensis]